VATILTLILFIYSVLGVHLFTFVAHGDPITNAHGGINPQRNFDTIGNAFLVLLQCLTADGWSTLMADAMQDETNGLCSVDMGDCGSPLAIPFFISFQIVGSFIFLNLVLAVILDNFATLYFISPDLVSSSDLEIFADVWSEFDPDATNYLVISKLPDLLLRVPRPLGVKGKTRTQATRLCLRLRVNQHSGLVEYHELLQELIENNFFRSGVDNDEALFKGVQTQFGMPSVQLKPPPPPLESITSEDADDEAERLPQEALAQENIAEIFAMAAMLQDDVKEVFHRSLTRARVRICAPENGGTSNGIHRVATPRSARSERMPHQGSSFKESFKGAIKEPGISISKRMAVWSARRRHVCVLSATGPSEQTVQGAGSTVQGAGSTVQGAGSTVQGAGSTVQGAGSTVQGAGSTTTQRTSMPPSLHLPRPSVARCSDERPLNGSASSFNRRRGLRYPPFVRSLPWA